MRRHVCGARASWPVPVDSGTSSAQHVPAFTLGSEPEPWRPAFLGILLRALEGLDCCPQASPLWATPLRVVSLVASPSRELRCGPPPAHGDPRGCRGSARNPTSSRRTLRF